LIVWKLAATDEVSLSIALPLEDVAEPRPQPWLVHLLEVNTMNFCSFAACVSRPIPEAAAEELLIAVPNTLASEAVRLPLPIETTFKSFVF
jgi:ASTRA-associated protein 1